MYVRYLCVHVQLLHVCLCVHVCKRDLRERGRERGEGERKRAYNSYKVIMSFQVLCQAELHLEEVTKERSLYKTAIDTAKESIRQFFTSDGVFNFPQPACNSPPCSKAHYSFDMAQQVFYPNDPQQPGPIPCISLPQEVCHLWSML